jgi:hypothetical protein
MPVEHKHNPYLCYYCYNLQEIIYRQTQLVYNIYCILATRFDTMHLSAGQKYKIHKTYVYKRINLLAPEFYI